jgi:hypothetical protein
MYFYDEGCLGPGVEGAEKSLLDLFLIKAHSIPFKAFIF